MFSIQLLATIQSPSVKAMISPFAFLIPIFLPAAAVLPGLFKTIISGKFSLIIFTVLSVEHPSTTITSLGISDPSYIAFSVSNILFSSLYTGITTEIVISSLPPDFHIKTILSKSFILVKISIL